MTTNILSPNWMGDTAAPIDPDTIRFKAAPAPVAGECNGCLFIGQRASTCRHANDLAAVNDQPDCDQLLPDGRSIIYILDDSDPRQLPLLEKGH